MGGREQRRLNPCHPIVSFVFFFSAVPASELSSSQRHGGSQAKPELQQKAKAEEASPGLGAT